MVDGIEMIFSKEKMMKRIEKSGLINLVGEKEMSMIDNLNGCPVSSANWNRRVLGMPVYSCTGKDGKTYDVNEADCIVK